jgi:hypothetical protein
MKERNGRRVNSMKGVIFSNTSILGGNSLDSPYKASLQSAFFLKKKAHDLRIRKLSKQTTYAGQNEEKNRSGSFIIHSKSESGQFDKFLSQNAQMFMNIFQSRIKSLQIIEDKTEAELQICLEMLTELGELFKPFSEVMRMIKETVRNCTKQSANHAEIKELLVQANENNLKYAKNNENLLKEKSLLVKKLNKSVDELERVIKENSQLSQKVKEMEARMKPSDNFLDHDKVMESMLKQAETIGKQKNLLSEYLLKEMRFKEMIEKLVSAYPKSGKIIEENYSDLDLDYRKDLND